MRSAWTRSTGTQGTMPVLPTAAKVKRRCCTQFSSTRRAVSVEAQASISCRRPARSRIAEHVRFGRLSKHQRAVMAHASVDVRVAELEELCSSALRGMGHTDEDTAALTNVLMYAQVRGSSQGLIKVTSGTVKPDANAGAITTARETHVSALLQGNGQPGIVVLSRAATLAAEKAEQSGVGVVATNGTCTTTGALSHYGEMLAERGLVGIVLAQSPEYVAPTGASKAIFGTNPICIAVPSAKGPAILDMATSAYAWYGVVAAATAGAQLPEGVAMDAEGRDTTDAQAVLDGGALKVFDRGHKGSGLALMIELLSGALVGGAVQDKHASQNHGNLVVAIDPSMFQERAMFEEKVQTVLDRVKAAPLQPGTKGIRLPGERAAAAAAAAEQSGSISVEETMLQKLRDLAAGGAGGDRGGAHSSGAGASGHPASGTGSSATQRAGVAASNGAGAAPSSAGAAASKTKKDWGVATRLAHPTAAGTDDPYASMAPPLYQTATFKQPSAVENGPYDYTRSGNPTRDILEANMAALEGGVRGLAFVTGMAAINAACRLVKSGEHIVAGGDIYGGTSRLLSAVLPEQGIEVTNVDHTDIDAYRKAFRKGRTKLVLLESPTNPRMQVCDLKALTDVAHEHGALVMVDNSIMTACYQRPLELGADISMISATKFVGGHSDVTGGILSFADAELAKQVYFYQNAEGTGLPPFECWLALRGLKTMKLRLDKAATNAAAIADFLQTHPLVQKVNYAALPGTPEAALNAKQASSGGALLSFTTGDVAVSKFVAEETQLFSITVSFGSTSSLISLPCYMSHASIPAEVRAERGLPDDLVRISAGIEDVEDLIDDLARALDGAKAVAGGGKQPPAGEVPVSAGSVDLAKVDLLGEEASTGA